MTDFRLSSVLLAAACAPQAAPQAPAPAPICVAAGQAATFLRSITSEWLADTVLTHRVHWQAAGQHIDPVTEGPMCARAAAALARSATPTRPDSVALVRAGNRYAAVRTGQVDVVLILDEQGRELEAEVLE